jgi:hypothetical protein
MEEYTQENKQKTKPIFICAIIRSYSEVVSIAFLLNEVFR